ncbi:hypothetical protein ACWCPJ_38555 [Streptomyces collinus]
MTALLGLWHRLDGTGGALLPAGLSDHLRRMLHILGLDQILVMVSPPAQALREIGRLHGATSPSRSPQAGSQSA